VYLTCSKKLTGSQLRLLYVIRRLHLSVQSNQNVQYKRKSVQFKMGKRAVQLLAYLQSDL